MTNSDLFESERLDSEGALILFSSLFHPNCLSPYCNHCKGFADYLYPAVIQDIVNVA